MKELTLFYLETCPHCRRARGYMAELQKENPEYAKIPIKMVEERQQKSTADQYDYFLVPTFYIGDKKVSEGVVDKDGVKSIFEQALKA